MYAVLAVVSATLQLGFIFESQRSLVFQVPMVDAAAYHAQALALVAGQSETGRAFWQPPLYPYLLSELYRVGVTDLLPVRCAQVLLGIAAALLACAIGRRCGGPWIGFAAGLGVCFYGPLVFYFSQLLPTGLAVTLNLWSLLLLLRLAEKPDWTRALALGLVAGLATLNVVNSAVILMVALGWIIWESVKTRRRGEASLQSKDRKRPAYYLVATALLAGFVLVLMPVTIRNYRVSKEFVPIATNGGINLYIGNNPHLERTLSVRPGMDWGRLVALPYRQGVKTDAQADRYFLGQVAEFVKESPWLFIKGLGQKTWEAIGSREIPRNEDIYAFAEHSSVLRALVWRFGGFGFPFGLIGPLAILGAVIMTRRHTARSLVLFFAVGYTASVILFFPASRYLAPAIPALLILAMLGVAHLVQWASLPVRSRVVLVAVLVLAGLLVNWPRRLSADRTNYAAELHTYAGVGLQTRGRIQEAMGEYQQAIQMDPDYADAHRYLGAAYQASGKTDLAVKEFECAIVLRPDHEEAIGDLAVIRFEQGKVIEAIDMLHTVLELNPDNRTAMINLGVGLMRLKRKTEAAEWFKKAGVAVPTAKVVKKGK